MSPVRLFGGFLLASLIGARLASASAAEVRLEIAFPGERVGRFETVEFSVGWEESYGNPFDPEEIDIALEVEGPGERAVSVPAFFFQGYERKRVERGGRPEDWIYPRGLPCWRARFAPLEVGPHTARARVRDRDGERISADVRFECVPSERRGYVRASDRDPRFYRLSTGEPFFAIGQNLAFIGEGQYVTLSRAEEIFRKLAANGANHLRIWTCCEDWALALEARKSAWGRSWAWDPPIAADPTDPAGKRRSVRLSRPGRSAVECSPSHALALKPSTRYRLSGFVRLEGDAELWVDFDPGLGGALAARGEARERTGFSREFAAGPGQHWLGSLRFRLEGDGAAWLDGLSLKEAAGGPELLWEADLERPLPGAYNLLDAYLLDRIVEAAEREGLRLQLCVLTRDLYMKSLADERSPEYAAATRAAKNLLRYAVARWGASASVATWEYFNELDPGLPAGRFYDAVGAHLEAVDPWRHLRATSTWHPSPRDWKHPRLDVADMHFYIRPEDEKKHRDEVEALLDRARFLREGAPGKPALLSEFGIATEKWAFRPETRGDAELIHFHNALWASALSGLSGTAHFWWWEELDRMECYPHYRPLAAFLADVPFGLERLEPVAAEASPEGLRVVGLAGEGKGWAWIQDRRSTWLGGKSRPEPSEVRGATLRVRGCAEGTWWVEWWGTRSAGRLGETRAAAGPDGVLAVEVPPFERDVAAKILRR